MRINTVITEQPLKLEGLQDVLSKLNVGDVIKAKVLEMTSGELLLKLFDGTVLKASAMSELDASPGSQLELEVKGRVEGKLILETVKGEIKSVENKQNEARHILQDLDMEPEAKNLELAAEIKNSGVKATRQLFDQASEMLQKFSMLTPDKAVFLSSKNISPEQGNINTLMKLVEGSLKLGSQLDDLIETISTISKGIFSDDLSNEQSQTISRNIQILNEKEPQNAALIKTAGFDNNHGKHINKVSTDSSNEILILNKEPALNKSTKAGYTNASGLLDQDHANDSQIQKAAHSNESIDEYKPASRNIPGEIKIKDTDVLELQKLMKGPGLIDEIEFISVKDTVILTSIHKEKDTLNKLIDSFKELFIKTDSEDLKNNLEVKKLYRDILDKLENIKDAVNSLALHDKNDITAKINNIEDGIKMLNQFNSNSTYVQIPLNISGYNTTGELYIMKKEKSRKRIDPQNVVMLIALDTSNIGHIETLIDVKGKNVSINLRAEDLDIVDFLKENYRHLYNSLSEKGFRLVDVKYRLVTEKLNLLNAEHEAAEATGDSRTSLDVKI